MDIIIAKHKDSARLPTRASAAQFAAFLQGRGVSATRDPWWDPRCVRFPESEVELVRQAAREFAEKNPA